MDELEHIITEIISKKHRNLFTFLTGAGLSAESGIPTYRGSDGIWIKGTKNYRPEEFGTFKHFLEEPEEVWIYTLYRKKMFAEANPNPSHHALAEIETLLQDRFQLITQNIDGLHYRAGSRKMYEIHGNIREMKCGAGCKGILPLPEAVAVKTLDDALTETEKALLKCPACGAWMRPNVLWFDEYYDEKTHKKFSALKAAKNSGMLFILGTSGATSLPLAITETALKYGAFIIDVNIEDNQFTALIQKNKRKIIIRKKTSEVLAVVLELIRKHTNFEEQGIDE